MDDKSSLMKNVAGSTTRKKLEAEAVLEKDGRIRESLLQPGCVVRLARCQDEGKGSGTVWGYMA